MLWFFLALGSATAFAASNITDKLLLHKIKYPGSINMIGASLGGLLGIVVLLVHHTPTTIMSAIIGMGIGVLGFAGVGLYLIAVKYEEVSRVVPLWTFTDIVVALLALVFLHEKLTPYLGVAIVAVVVGSILLESDPRLGFLTRKPKVIMLMFAASFIWGVGVVLARSVSMDGDPTTLWGWQLIGSGSVGFILLLLNQKSARIDLRTPRAFLGIAMSQATETVGILCKFFALSLAFAAPIQVVTDASSYLVVFLVMIPLSRLYPKSLHEDTDRANVITKIIALACITLGLVLASQ